MCLNQCMFRIVLPRLVALLTFLFMLVMNALATTLPLNGQSTNEISDRYDTLFAPIGFTFAIWGIIYLALGVYTVVQLVADNALIREITPWFIASNLLNGVWIIAWHYELLWLAAIIIVALLLTLMKINTRTTKQRVEIGSSLTIRLPFSIYSGWVTVATVANISALLVQVGLGDGFWLSAEAWTIVILVVAALIGIVTSWVNTSPAYVAVFVWAYWGILSRHLSPDEWNQQYPGIILTTQILLALLAFATIVAFVRWFRAPKVPLPTTGLRSARLDETSSTAAT